MKMCEDATQSVARHACATQGESEGDVPIDKITILSLDVPP